MFNEKVRAAIYNLTSVSKNAANIASRLEEKAGVSLSAVERVEDVAELKKQIDTLNQQLAEVRNYINNFDDDQEKELSEEEKQHFIQGFTASLGTQPFVVPEQVYDEEYLEAYPRNTRYLICTALVNWCHSRKFEPSQLWYSVMVNNGSM